jgi:hypothetical protein
MKKSELLKQFPWILKGELDYEFRHVRSEYKTERGFMNHLAKLNESNKQKFGMSDISELHIDVEWKRSRYWGNCPRAEWQCWFKDGSFMSGSEYASGCGYDKLSQVISFAFNKVAKGMAYRKRNSRKKAPYGIAHVGAGADKKWNPYFEGGIGANCYYAIAKYLGGKMEWKEGKTWDSFVFTFK